MRRALFASLGFLATAGIANAAAIDGRWSLFAADCTAELSDAILTVDTAAGTLRYWESECTITNLTAIGTFESVWQLEMSCSGEGDTWQRTALLAVDIPLDGDGSPRLIEVSLDDGFVVSRAWCGPVAPRTK
ncbi:MAG: hypothetical protein IT534_13790 [Bauldia sp.]|jgi:hypothetical protein|nr:hypothetical protein [Bauldia sp.]